MLTDIVVEALVSDIETREVLSDAWGSVPKDIKDGIWLNWGGIIEEAKENKEMMARFLLADLASFPCVSDAWWGLDETTKLRMRDDWVDIIKELT